MNRITAQIIVTHADGSQYIDKGSASGSTFAIACQRLARAAAVDNRRENGRVVGLRLDIHEVQ